MVRNVDKFYLNVLKVTGKEIRRTGSGKVTGKEIK